MRCRCDPLLPAVTTTAAACTAALGFKLAWLLTPPPPTPTHTHTHTHEQASEEWVDVLTDGFAFRLLLATERDEAMRRRQAQLGGRGCCRGGPPPRRPRAATAAALYGGS
jgi:hypothetical protein